MGAVPDFRFCIAGKRPSRQSGVTPLILDDTDRNIGWPMPKTKRCSHPRGSADCRFHQTHQDKLDASIALKVSHDPSARRRRLKWALAGSTALVAVALMGTLLFAVTPVFAEGGRGGANAGSGSGGPGGLDQPTSTGNTGFAGTDGGGGGGAGAGSTGGTGGWGGNDAGNGGGPGGTGGSGAGVHGSIGIDGYAGGGGGG